MQKNDVIHGFRIERVRPVEELNATLWEMTHEKTGAALCWVERKEENKTFAIAFKTLPEDSTGVFHIIEHSVLCGSDKYPVKEPFVELLKSSVQTFLNAFTYPDKTVYPVSSRNDRDFLNLIDVYLDAVLHPLIYHKPEIFRQEGWRYEGEGEALCYQGVVFNEMKGSFASPQTVMYNELQRALFPDNCYRYVSGGDPACIPDLTYEQFIASHRKYYHPSNARISLVGSIDLDAVLAKIDTFLSAFDRLDADFTIRTQRPIERVTKEVPFEIGAEESLEGRAMIASVTVLGDYSARERLFAAGVLADYLAGDNDAPLKRAVIDRGLAQDFSVEVWDGLQECAIGWQAMNTDAEKREALETAVNETVGQIVKDGLDRERLSACLHSFAFRKRDRDGGWVPRSLSEALSLLDTWLYGGDPLEGISVEAPLRTLEERLNGTYFEDLLREFFLDGAHTATIVLVPSKTLGEEKRAKEAARIKAERATWTEADRERIRREAEALRVFPQRHTGTALHGENRNRRRHRAHAYGRQRAVPYPAALCGGRSLACRIACAFGTVSCARQYGDKGAYARGAAACDQKYDRQAGRFADGTARKRRKSLPRAAHGQRILSEGTDGSGCRTPYGDPSGNRIYRRGPCEGDRAADRGRRKAFAARRGSPLRHDALRRI